jgi:putative ABC transport system permease protein
MNLFQLVFKQMRQRALGTWLTTLSILLSVALATAVLIAYRESGKVFGQSDYGYDVIVGAKGSKLQLVLNTVYHMDVSPGNVPYAVYEGLSAPNNRFVKAAVPYGVGDTYKGHRIVGTLPRLFGVDDEGKPLAADRVLEYRPGRRYELAEGRPFHPEKFEAVIGHEVAQRQGLKLGGTFKATHGMPAEGQTPDEHDDQWTVVGILKPTQTANDSVLFIPLISFFAIQEHGEGLKAQNALRSAMGQGAGGPPGTPVLPGRRPGMPTAPAPAPVPTPAPSPATKPADGHDHDHDHAEGAKGQDHGPAGDEQAQPAAAQESAKQDHDHDHEHGDPDKTPAGKAPAAEAADVAHAGEDHAGHDHEHHPDHFHVHSDGTIHLDLPKEAWQVSAILIKSRGGVSGQSLMYMINNSPLGMAVNPAMVMREFFDTFFKGSVLLLLGLAALVTVVAAISILVSIYNAVSARQREIAIQRALGATRGRVLTQICLEAGLIGLIGGVLGIVVGHLIAGAGSVYFQQAIGERINWLQPDRWEGVYLIGVVVVAVLAGLVPGLKAYRTPVATNLVTV